MSGIEAEDTGTEAMIGVVFARCHRHAANRTVTRVLVVLRRRQRVSVL